MYLLGYDIGSSSIKAAIVEVSTGNSLGIENSPNTAMNIMAVQPGWAEQDPEIWWKHMQLSTIELLKKTSISPHQISAIGLSYQMHGLVCVNSNYELVRPSIIWCDSRATHLGEQAYQDLGEKHCLDHLLNSPGNFTASKLKWVQDNEPDVYDKIHKFMLVGDYIAYKLTGECSTTISALSEGILWDFAEDRISNELLDYYELDQSLVPEITDVIGIQGNLQLEAAEYLGLSPGIPLTYRGGDQPNNAMSLNVLNPGEVAATGGTSGVVYCVTDKKKADPLGRVNHFAHINHKQNDPRLGVLLCINGAGIQYDWINRHIAPNGVSYQTMESEIEKISIGSEGLRIIPFGNGAERMLGNLNTGSQIKNLHFNLHTRTHLYRAALEGVAFSFVMGMESMTELGIVIDSIKVGNDNLFQSKVFSATIASLTGSDIKVIDTTGAVGAAKAAGYGVGVYQSLGEAMSQQKIIQTYRPDTQQLESYQASFESWKEDVDTLINSFKP